MNNTRNFLLVIFSPLAFLLSACASVPVHPDEAKLVPADRIYYQSAPASPQMAKAIFIRDRCIHGNMVYYHLWINGIHAAALDVAERVDLWLEPGEYIFTVKPTDPIGMTISDSLDQTLHTGNEHVYRISSDGPIRIQRVHPAMQKRILQ